MRVWELIILFKLRHAPLATENIFFFMVIRHYDAPLATEYVFFFMVIRHYDTALKCIS